MPSPPLQPRVCNKIKERRNARYACRERTGREDRAAERTRERTETAGFEAACVVGMAGCWGDWDLVGKGAFEGVRQE